MRLRESRQGHYGGLEMGYVIFPYGVVFNEVDPQAQSLDEGYKATMFYACNKCHKTLYAPMLSALPVVCPHCAAAFPPIDLNDGAFAGGLPYPA